MPHDPDRFDNLVAPHVRALRSLLGQHMAALQSRGLTHSADAPLRPQIEEQAQWGIDGVASRPVDQALLTGIQYSVAGCDHLGAIGALVMTPEGVIFADKVLLRAGIEALARSAWLYEVGPHVDARERARRGLNERLHQLSRDIHAVDSNASLLDREPRVAERLSNAIERRSQLLAGAEDAGLGERSGPDRFGHVWIGTQRPTATKVLQYLLNRGDDAAIDMGGIVQATYSEFVHTSLGAVRKQALLDEPAGPPQGDLVLVPFGSRASDVMFTIEIAAGAVIAASTDVRAAMGWTEDEVWLRTVLDALAVLKADGDLASAPYRRSWQSSR